MELDPQPGVDSDAPYEALVSDAAPKTPIAVSLLYGLAVVALGVTGSFLPINLFSCPSPYNHPNQGRWTTNFISLPNNVWNWAKHDGHSSTDLDAADFLYIPSTGVTLFSGTNHSDGGKETLWEVSSDGTPPKGHPEYQQLFQFLLVTQDTGCFLANKRQAPYPSIACLDAQGFHASSSLDSRVIPYTLMASEGILWYMESDDDAEGVKVYSMNPTTMESMLHSSYTPRTSDSTTPTHCSEVTASRKKATLGLLLTGAPVTLVSVRLWIAKGIPSMAVTTLVGVSLIYTFLYITVWPEIPAIGLQLWYSLAGAAWTIILSRLLLFSQLRKWPLVWGINSGGPCFFAGTYFLLGVANSDDLWRWIAVTFLCYAPLIVCGMGTGCMLLVILGAIGLLIDVLRFGIYLSSKMPDSWEFLVTFAVLAVGGIGIGALGYWLHKRQEAIRAILKSVLKCLWKSEDASSMGAPVNESIELLLNNEETDLRRLV
jgi:hypothetical protein